MSISTSTSGVVCPQMWTNYPRGRFNFGRKLSIIILSTTLTIYVPTLRLFGDGGFVQDKLPQRSIAQFHYFERDHEMKQYIVDAFTDKPFSGNPAAVFHYFERDHEMKQYIVDAFTDKPFSGNPAAVCVMEKWPSEESMM